MKKKGIVFFILIVIILTLLSLYFQYKPSLTGNIVFNQTVIVGTGAYPRMEKVANDVLIVGSDDASSIKFYKSTDNGTTWSFLSKIDPGITNEFVANVAPLYLGNNILICAFRFSVGNNFKIAVYKSTDNGATWNFLSNLAQTTSGGLYEPFLLKNRNEILGFYAYEPVLNGAIQYISMRKSLDGGLTWSERKDITPGQRDGMPSAIKKNNGNILLVFESERDAMPLDVLSIQSIESSDNGNTWKNQKTLHATNKRAGCLASGPYIAKLSNNVFITSYQSDEDMDYCGKSSNSNWKAKYVYSLDEGLTWSSPQYLFYGSGNLWNSVYSTGKFPSDFIGLTTGIGIKWLASPCTSSDYQFTISPSTCPQSGQQTKVYSKIGYCDASLGTAKPADSQISCTYQAPICTNFNYSQWSDCNSSGIQTRTINSSSPAGCTGGNSQLTQNCLPPCNKTNWISDLSPSNCPNSGQQNQTWVKIGNCNETLGTKFDNTTINCTYQAPICIDFNYTAWSDCNPSGIQTRTETSRNPLNCQGTPITSQECNYTLQQTNNSSETNKSIMNQANNISTIKNISQNLTNTNTSIKNVAVPEKRVGSFLKIITTKIMCRISNLFNKEKYLSCLERRI
jgi:hypothetical protein